MYVTFLLCAKGLVSLKYLYMIRRGPVQDLERVSQWTKAPNQAGVFSDTAHA